MKSLCTNHRHYCGQVHSLVERAATCVELLYGFLTVFLMPDLLLPNTKWWFLARVLSFDASKFAFPFGSPVYLSITVENISKNDVLCHWTLSRAIAVLIHCSATIYALAELRKKFAHSYSCRRNRFDCYKFLAALRALFRMLISLLFAVLLPCHKIDLIYR